MKRILCKFSYIIATAISTTLILSSCATVPPSEPGVKMPWKKRETTLTKIHSWNLSGKIGVVTAKDSGSANVKWLQQQNSYTLTLFGPLGAGGMTLKGRPGAVSLRLSNGKTLTAASPEKLLAQNWGFDIPVSYMNYWIRGVPVPSLPANTKFDQYNRLTSLSQSGYNIQYQGYTKTSSADLPNRISISSSNIKVKIIVYSWQVA